MTAAKKAPSNALAEPGLPAVGFLQFECRTSGLLLGLLDRSRNSLSDGDLTHLAALTDEAGYMVERIAKLCEGLGCLIASDSDDGPVAVTGSFQSAPDVSALLFLLAGVADHASGLLEVAGFAKSQQLARSAGGKA